MALLSGTGRNAMGWKARWVTGEKLLTAEPPPVAFTHIGRRSAICASVVP